MHIIVATSTAIKYCEDTIPLNQLNAAKEQHKDLCNILLGVGGTF